MIRQLLDECCVCQRREGHAQVLKVIRRTDETCENSIPTETHDLQISWATLWTIAGFCGEPQCLPHAGLLSHSFRSSDCSQDCASGGSSSWCWWLHWREGLFCGRLAPVPPGQGLLGQDLAGILSSQHEHDFRSVTRRANYPA